jgi:xylulokinase
VGTSADEYVVALDLGTSGLKVAVTTPRGEIVGSAVERYPLHVLDGGGVEQDPEDWWQAIARGTRRLLGESGVEPGRVVAVACSSQWSGTVPVDERGRPLMRAIIWMDSRGAEHSGKDTVAHILYVRHRLPDVYRRARKFLEPRDWVNFQLTGRMASSPDAATLLWATDTRDVDAVRYDDRLLGIAGLDRDKLPDLVPTATVLGRLRPEAAAALGPPPTAQVVTGAPDLMASAIGAGTVADFDANLYLGTSSWLVCHVPYRRPTCSTTWPRSPRPSPAATCSPTSRSRRACAWPSSSASSCLPRTAARRQGRARMRTGPCWPWPRRSRPAATA